MRSVGSQVADPAETKLLGVDGCALNNMAMEKKSLVVKGIAAEF